MSMTEYDRMVILLAGILANPNYLGTPIKKAEIAKKLLAALKMELGLR